MTATGPIAWRARMEIPATWDALAQTSTFGDLSLSLKLAYIKISLFSTNVLESAEASVYDELTLMYAGKRLALEVIPSGMDYWMDQAISFSGAASRSSESVSYTDRIKALQVTYARLQEEAKKLGDLLSATSSISKATQRMTMPATTADGHVFRTPDPWSFAPLFTTFEPVLL